MQAQVASLSESLADAERRVYEGELVRRKLHNIIQVGQSVASSSGSTDMPKGITNTRLVKDLPAVSSPLATGTMRGKVRDVFRFKHAYSFAALASGLMPTCEQEVLHWRFSVY